MRCLRPAAIACAILLHAVWAGAQTYAIPTHVIAGGGGTSSNGGFTLTGTIGQDDAGATSSAGSYSLTGGFWTTLALPFTDDPLTPGVSIVRALHVSELRVRVNALRTRFGLAAASFTDPTITVGTTIIKASHIQELRDALVEVYQHVSVTPPTFTDPSLGPATTAVRVVHFSELRAAVLALEAR